MAVTGPTSAEIRIALGFTVALLLGCSLLQTVTLEARKYDFSTRYASGLILRRGDGSKLAIQGTRSWPRRQRSPQ